VQIINAATKIKSHALDDKILAAVDDADKSVASTAKNAVKSLKLQKKDKNAPLIGTLKPDDVIAQVVTMKGDAGLGEQLFTKQTCIACHTTSQDQPQKGPYLGNIAQTYKRPDLAANTLDPNKTIAQGFATNVFTLKDGSQNLGFVTNESGDKVTIRTIAADRGAPLLAESVEVIRSSPHLQVKHHRPGAARDQTHQTNGHRRLTDRRRQSRRHQSHHRRRSRDRHDHHRARAFAAWPKGRLRALRHGQ
jgi:putative heme-binding domain-containing protein